MNQPVTDVDPRTVIDVLLGRVQNLTAEVVALQAQLLTLANQRQPCGCEEGGDDGSTAGGSQAA